VTNKPLVSVVMGACNAEHSIEAAILSVLNQSYENLELVVVNDGSVDRTPTIVDKFCQSDRRVRKLDKENEGLTRALIDGVQLSAGDYLARIDADDVWHREKLDLQMDVLLTQPEICLLGTFAECGRSTRRELVGGCIEAEQLMLTGNPFVHSSVVFNRAVYERTGGYDPGVRVAQDYHLWARMMQHGKIRILCAPLVERGQGPNNISYTREREQRIICLRVKLSFLARGMLSFRCLVSMVKDLAVILFPRRSRTLFKKYFFYNVRI
jgi:glycosyltransferase involved in cell wall biosynthesis